MAINQTLGLSLLKWEVNQSPLGGSAPPELGGATRAQQGGEGKGQLWVCPDLSSSTRQNSIRVLGDMSPSTYFERPHHLEFHDFTPGRQFPSASKLILGLSYKFVPRPKAATTRKSHGGIREVGELFQLESLFCGRK